MKILLLSAYDAQSHQYWRKGLVAAFDQYHWTVLTLPGRFFSWRVRGNSLSWALNEKEILSQHYDLIIATSMTDLSALKGLVPNLAAIPTIVYFHENQFAYPKSGNEFGSVEPQITSIYTALVADKVLFNSVYNQQTFLQGTTKLLKKLPDHVPPNIVAQIEQKSTVLHVPLKDETELTPEKSSQQLQLIWNHRWEFDKGPELLYSFLAELSKQPNINQQATVHIVGQQFRYSPNIFDKIATDFAPLLGQFGFIERYSEYQQLLTNSDVVLSTSKHDFQGLSILEAVQAGAIPLLPNNLAYPEFFSDEFLYPATNDELAAKAMATKIVEYIKLKQANNLPSAPDITRLHWSQLKASYQAVITSIISE